MDQLDRLFQRLVHNIRSRNPAHLTLPFTVAELYEQIVPYRHNRRELGMETNQDYEIAILRLLSGERGYLLGDPAMQEELGKVLEARDPDPGAFREYAHAEVSISPAGLERAGTGRPRAAAPAPAKASAAAPTARAATPPSDGAAAAMTASPPTAAADGAQATAVSGSAPEAEAAAAAREAAEAITEEPAHVEDSCRFCGTTLPRGREVKFCPNCGQNLAVSRCPACGSEIEAGWRFCITCGREAESDYG